LETIASTVKNIFKPKPNVTPTDDSFSCTQKLSEYIQIGVQNNPEQVKILEQFLNDHEKENLRVNGIYELEDFEAVKRFQVKYASDILSPWSSSAPTGYVYITTVAKINSFFCRDKITLADKCPYFLTYHKFGDVGGDVKKIQNFLNTTMNANIAENGLYDFWTRNAVSKFQALYDKTILYSWGIVQPTGRWYVTTRKQANSLVGCTDPNSITTFFRKLIE
jgi:hypothetical protein